MANAPFDRELIRALARCWMRAAVDELINELDQKAASTEERVPRSRKATSIKTKRNTPKAKS